MSLQESKIENYGNEIHWTEYYKYLDTHFSIVVKELEQRFAQHTILQSSWNSLKAFIMNKGKRVRPLLFLSSYALFSNNRKRIPDSVYSVACALEIFHSFALIHDDIIDDSHSRRGEPTLHNRLQQERCIKDSTKCTHLAIVFGDILFGFAMECMLNSDLPDAYAVPALRYFLKIAQKTGMGQAVEIAHLEQSLAEVSKEAIMETYSLKTSHYTIEGPIVLGALLAGAEPQVLEQICHFSQPLGLAFQIENDLHELNQMNQKKASFAYDLRSGVKTYLMKCFYEALNSRDKLLLENCLRPGGTPHPFALIAQLLNKTTVKKNLEKMVGQFFTESLNRLETSDFNRTQKRALRELIHYLSKNSHHFLFM